MKNRFNIIRGFHTLYIRLSYIILSLINILYILIVGGGGGC